MKPKSSKYEWGCLLIRDQRMGRAQKRNKSLKSVLETAGVDALIESKTDIECCRVSTEEVSENTTEVGTEEVNENTAEVGTTITTNTVYGRIPEKPVIGTGASTTPEKYANEERKTFNEWKAKISERMADTGEVVPYERNINVWRQLWSVFERSKVVMEVVDARNPLIYKVEEIKEMAEKKNKKYVLLMNKSDLLSEKQKHTWKQHFSSEKTDILFCSSKSGYGTENLRKYLQGSGGPVGMIGQPNVGKSSTINSLCGHRAVQTSATPGKTKSLQTVTTTDNIVLYDCPGLVFPHFLATRTELILNGILSLDQTRDVKECIKVLVQRLGIRRICYVMKVRNFVNDSRKTVEDNVIDAIKTSTGCTNEGKIVKDLIRGFISGRMGYAYPPPHIPADEYNRETVQVPETYQVNEAVNYDWYSKDKALKKKDPDLSPEQLLYTKKHYLKKGLKREFKKTR